MSKAARTCRSLRWSSLIAPFFMLIWKKPSPSWVTTARRDFNRAQELDPKDPTPWLYSAIQNKQENRYNAALRDLKRSLEFNENWCISRSLIKIARSGARTSPPFTRTTAWPRWLCASQSEP